MSPVAAVFLAFLAAEVIVEAGLVLANLAHAARSRGVPAPLAGRVAPETAERSRAYALANGRIALAGIALAAATTLAALFSGLLPWLEGALAGAGLAGPHLFVAYLTLLAAALSLPGLPLSLWRTFGVEARFGFNRTTPGLWLLDRVKGLLVSAALGIPLLYAVHAFMRSAGGAWWLWLAGFLALVQLLLLWLWPALVAPLYNRFDPLPPGPLRERLVALAGAAGFRNRGLFVMDASRRTGHSNAWFAGIFRPRIVLFDTLVERMTVDEAASVLAHEIGHFSLRHVQRGLAVSVAGTAVSLFVLSLLVDWPPLFTAFGFERPSLHAAAALLSLCGGAFTFWLAPAGAWLSRRHEYAADRFAVRLARAPDALASALVRLNGENLSNLHPHPWYGAWHHGHPALVERLAAIDREAARLPAA